jgi:dolichol-phosphate mannosyltransferase
MKVCIVLPTYNEKENIGKLLDELLDVFKNIKYFDMNILIVDDNSPDGTQDVVKKFLGDNVFMITGEKRGLGDAYIRGFKYAIDELKTDIVFEMDADFSHSPKDIPRFLEEIKENDFVIGSRYIEGGDTPDWSFNRKLISSGGNFFARIIAGLYKVKDCTSGYRAIKSELIKKIDMDSLDVKGYSFQMNLLFNAIKRNGRIKEIPIIFLDRHVGTSKIERKDMYEFFINSFKLRFR